MQYVEAWPKTLFSEGIGYPNLSVPLPQQRAGAFKEAKLVGLSSIYHQIELFQINGREFISHIISKNQDIQDNLQNYISSTYKLLDTRYMSDGSVEIEISLSTDSIIDILEDK